MTEAGRAFVCSGRVRFGMLQIGVVAAEQPGADQAQCYPEHGIGQQRSDDELRFECFRRETLMNQRLRRTDHMRRNQNGSAQHFEQRVLTEDQQREAGSGRSCGANPPTDAD